MANDIQQLTDLKNIDSSSFEQSEAYIQQILTETFPDRDYTVGTTLYWNVVVPLAAGAAALLTNGRLIQASLYLDNIRANPELATEEMASLLLKNYFVEAESGTRSTGQVEIVVSSLSSYVIQSGTQFTFDGLTYETTQTIYAYTSASQVTQANDRLVQPKSDGNYRFLVPVQASAIGASYFVRKGSVLSLSSAPRSFVKSVAASDISGGTDDESFSDLAARVPTTFAGQTFGSESNISSLVTGQFPGSKVSVTGMGDQEMLRDKHNILGVSTGGMQDVWVATQTNAAKAQYTWTATLVNTVSKLWRLTVPASDVPGVYVALEVYPEGSDQSGISISSQSRGYSLPTSGYKPIVESGAEAAFSKYQTLTIEFVDNVSNHAGLSAGDTASYDVTVLEMPLIEDISNFFVTNKYFHRASNTLVRGAVPCVVSISAVVRLLDSDFEQSISLAQLKSEIITRVYSLGFDYGVLSSSLIHDVIHDYLTGRSNVASTEMVLQGDIYAPNGEKLILRSDNELRIPSEPAKQVTPRTTVFLVDSDSIDISFERVET